MLRFTAFTLSYSTQLLYLFTRFRGVTSGYTFASGPVYLFSLISEDVTGRCISEEAGVLIFY